MRKHGTLSQFPAQSSHNGSRQEEKPAEGKMLLQVAHYRTVEIDKAEIDNLVDTIKSSGADSCEYTIVNAFFKLTKTRLHNGMSRCLDNREVMELWEQFKESVTCSLKREGA